MAKPKSRAHQSVKDLTVAKLDEVLTAVQNLFILQALNANMNGKDIRALLKVDILYTSGERRDVEVLCRIDTLDELDYFHDGGILSYVLRNLARAA